jgi:hypothetical protein
MEEQRSEIQVPLKKIVVITDFGDMDEAREWREKFEIEAKQSERRTNDQDFQ